MYLFKNKEVKNVQDILYNEKMRGAEEQARIDNENFQRKMLI